MNLRCTLFFWSIHHAALLNSDKCFFFFFFPTISRPMFPSNTTLKISTVLLLTTETQQAVPLPFIYPLGTFPNYYCYSLHISWERPQVLSSPWSQSCPMTVLSLLLPTAACHFVLCPLRCFYCVFTSQEKKKGLHKREKTPRMRFFGFERARVGVAAGKLCHLLTTRIKAAENPKKLKQDSNMVYDINAVPPRILSFRINNEKNIFTCKQLVKRVIYFFFFCPVSQEDATGRSGQWETRKFTSRGESEAPRGLKLTVTSAPLAELRAPAPGWGGGGAVSGSGGAIIRQWHCLAPPTSSSSNPRPP